MLREEKGIYIDWFKYATWKSIFPISMHRSKWEKNESYICANYVKMLWMRIHEQTSSIDFGTIDNTSTHMYIDIG